MDKVYADLIEKGALSIEDVPSVIRTAVQVELEVRKKVRGDA